jgi:hypothetical protein
MSSSEVVNSADNLRAAVNALDESIVKLVDDAALRPSR